MENQTTKPSKKMTTREDYHRELAEMEARNKYSVPEEAKAIAARENQPPPLVENLMDLETAIRYAQHAGTHVEVAEHVFNMVSKGSSKPYYTAGKPGVKVIKEGFVQRVHDLEMMNAEDAHTANLRDKNLWNTK